MKPEVRSALVELSKQSGVGIYIVGGPVRDRLMGKPVKDFDLAVEGEVEPFAEAAGRLLPGSEIRSFGRFGTARLIWEGGRLDFARTRGELYTAPAALPIVRPADIHTDLIRRDFTVNAMAEPLAGGEPLDFHGGRRDLKAKVLRILHIGSFADDPTRVFRAARFAGRFGFKLEPMTERALRAAVEARQPGLLSRERIREELLRILEEKDPAKALALLKAWGALPYVWEGLSWTAADFKDPDPWVRLGLLALRLGPRGAAFLDSFNLERSKRGSLGLALEIAARKATPPYYDALTQRILVLGVAKLAPAALAAPLAGGEDIKALGLKPGPYFGSLLEELARAQWAGKLKTRAQALAWLKTKAKS